MATKFVRAAWHGFTAKTSRATWRRDSCAWWKLRPSRRPAPWGRATANSATRLRPRPCGKTMDSIPMRGTIVIGEGERDEAPMLYIGEKVGAEFPDGTEVPEVDIAVDPLEGTNLCATGAPGSITVLAASERGGLLNAPDCYMDKIVVGPSCKDAVVSGRAGCRTI